MRAFPRNTSSCDDASEDSVMGKLSVSRLREEGRCGEQHQGLSLVQRPRQPLADGMYC
jgi:hypothetical protein